MRIRNAIWCVFLLIVGCAGQVNDTPNDNKIHAFYIKKLTLKLIESDDAIPGSKQFSSEETLSKDFYYSIQKHLVEDHVYATHPGPNVGEVVIHIDYLRRYKNGGHALNRPLVSHHITVYQNGKEVAQLVAKNYTPLYGYFRAVFVNIERAIHEWDQKDEHVDADNLSESIVNDLEEKFNL